MQQYIEIYQEHNKLLYYVKDQHPLNDEIFVLDLNNFSFSGEEIIYEVLYGKYNSCINEQIKFKSIQINKTGDGFSEALICAFLIFKDFSLENALEVFLVLFKVLKMLKIEIPLRQYLPSLKRYEEKFQQDELRSYRSSILSIDNADITQQQLIQSEILNFPVFSQRLIESQRFSTILGTEDQIESELMSLRYPSTMTFGQQESVTDEPKINFMQSTIKRSRK